MLVLSRTIGEAIVFDGDVTLSVDSFTVASTTLTVSNLTTSDERKVIILNLREQVEILPNVRVMLVEVLPETSRVRLGVEAPRNIAIYRKELLPPKDI